MARGAFEAGWVDSQLADELPGLALTCLRVEARASRSPGPLREQLRTLASRITGGKVVHSRQDSVPWAYRVLWRRLGLDPDSDRTPVERLMLERLEHGGLPSRGLPADAVVLAILETGVPVLVVDAAHVGAGLGMRPGRAGESLGGAPLRAGEVVYADESRPVARLTGDVAEDCAVSRETTEMLVCALGAAGVPQMAVEEALWMVADLLGAAVRLEASTEEEIP
jgi:DNA/RNA-binding domain of Phe-tRNA-synthetase-like protein